jgi:hypothetical protein
MLNGNKLKRFYFTIVSSIFFVISNNWYIFGDRATTIL